MTTPNMVTAPDGAYIIGGGEWKYGQSLTEALAHAMLLPPMPTPLNALALIEDNLKRLPLEALKVFQPFVPDSTDEMFLTIELAVETIIGIFTAPVAAVSEFLTKFSAFLGTIVNLDAWLVIFKQIIDFFVGITDSARTAWLAVFKNIVDTFVALSTTVGADLWTVLSGVITTFSTLFTSLGAPVWTVINQIITFFAGITAATRTVWLGVFKQVIDFFVTITNFSTWSALLKKVIDFFGTVTNFDLWIGVFKTVVDTFVTLLSTIGLSLWTVLGEILTFFSTKFTSPGSVIEWIKNNILKLPAVNLVGQVPDLSMGILNIGHLTAVPINLLAHPGFEDTTTVSPVDGWSWDSTQNATGTGGSSKVVLDGYNKELSHQTVVRVAAGDVMQLSAAVKTSGVTGTGWAASISVMEYRAGAIATPVVIASRTTNSSAWVTISGAYTVPVNVTSVVFRVTVTDATAGTVWFDNLDFHKSGNVAQDWVGNLNTTWENMWSGQFGDGTGKIWSDMGTNVRAGRDNTTIAVTNAGAAQGTANAAVTNAGAAQGTANAAVSNAATADGKAVAVATGLRTTVGGEAGTTGVPANTGTYLANLITKMYGTGAGVPQTYINNSALNGIPFTKMSGSLSGADITSSTIPVGALAPTTIPAIGAALGIAITTGSGAKMSRTNTLTKVTAGAGDNWFAAFFVNAGGSIQQDQISSDITVSLNGRYTVTHAGYYMVELGFTVNAARPAAGYFNVAPAIFLSGSSTPHKVGSDAMGSFGGGFGNNARTAHATFIVYLAAGGTVTAGYRNYGASNGSFFEGDANGNSTYFSIAMLNRTAEG
jgi:hypothetical protein